MQQPRQQDVDALQIDAAARREVLARCGEQFAAWSHPMPRVEPLVLDFGLGRFEDVGLIEFWLANETANGYCGKLMFLFPRQSCPTHSHRIKHETFYPLFGDARVVLDGQTTLLHPGEPMAIPVGKPHGFSACDTALLLLELSMSCDVMDNYFEDEQANAWLRRATGCGFGEA